MPAPNIAFDQIDKLSQGYRAVVFDTMTVHRGFGPDARSERLKLRYTVEVDHYDSQSHFKIEVFNPDDLKWNEVWTLEPTRYKGRPSYALSPQRAKDDWPPFVNRMLKELHDAAERVLA